MQEEEREHLKWELVAAGLWRSRCKSIFQDMHEPEAEVIKAIWNDLVHVLKSGIPLRDIGTM